MESIMQAITTKYLGPTDARGSRIVARCQAKRLTVPWDHALDVEANHRAAGRALVRLMGWHAPIYSVEWHMGALPDGSGYVLVATLDALRGEAGGSLVVTS